MRMTDDIEAEYARRKEALRQKFLEAMQERRDILAGALKGLGTSCNGTSHIHECRFAAHKTAGTAAAFGYVDLGRTARAACDAIDSITDEGSRAKALSSVERFRTEIDDLLRSDSVSCDA